jgi:2-polyprenyl-3-methyl-5-hydroxy-6-metoxy-1,4-benzoquinol methylase
LKKRGTLYSAYRVSRGALEKVPIFRTAIGYMLEIKGTLVDSSQRNRTDVEENFQELDPYGFARDLEQFRFQRAMEFLRMAKPEGVFPNALEVGCAEGMFTRMLSDRCGRLLALDLSPTALERAKQHCSDQKNIEFAEWDVRCDPISGTYDLIVATGVLEYILRPSILRDACERLTMALKPGGYLLVGNTVTDNEVERTWIGKMLIRGTLINDYIKKDPRFETIDESIDQCVCPFVHTLLRKRRN